MQCTTGLPHPCRQCLSCNMNARRIWASRMLLEAQCHEHNCFITLTYEKEPSDGKVVKSHLSAFFHRLRERARGDGRTVRFFGCGEYGERGGRPHYHAAVFGLGPSDAGIIEDAWHAMRDPVCTPGFVHVGTLTGDSAQYIAGYVAKKLGAPAGTRTEFGLMSRRPGIGVPALLEVINALNTSDGALYFARYRDVPTAFQVEGRLWPLGGHLRRQLRLFFFGEETQPKAAKELREKEFYAKNLPFVPPDASPTLRKVLAAKFAKQTTASHHAHHQALEQRAKQRSKRHSIRTAMRTL